MELWSCEFVYLYICIFVYLCRCVGVELWIGEVV